MRIDRRLAIILGCLALLAPAASHAADTQAPTVTITRPTNDEIVIWQDPPRVAGTASDDVGIISIKVQATTGMCTEDWYYCGKYEFPATCDGCTFPTAPGQTITWSSRSLRGDPAKHRIRAIVRDAAGNVGYSSDVYYWYPTGSWDCFATDLVEIFAPNLLSPLDDECTYYR